MNMRINMNSPKKTSWFLAPLLAIVLVAAACGSDSDNGESNVSAQDGDSSNLFEGGGSGGSGGSGAGASDPNQSAAQGNNGSDSGVPDTLIPPIGDLISPDGAPDGPPLADIDPGDIREYTPSEQAAQAKQIIIELAGRQGEELHFGSSLDQNNYDRSTPLGSVCWASWEYTRQVALITNWQIAAKYLQDYPSITDVVEDPNASPLVDSVKSISDDLELEGLLRNFGYEVLPSIAAAVRSTNPGSNAEFWRDYPTTEQRMLDFLQLIETEQALLQRLFEAGGSFNSDDFLLNSIIFGARAYIVNQFEPEDITEPNLINTSQPEGCGWGILE